MLLSGPYFNNTVPPADDHKGYATMPQVGLQAGCDMLRGSIVVGVEIEGWISPGDPPREPGHAIDPVKSILDIRERPSDAISLRNGVL